MAQIDLGSLIVAILVALFTFNPQFLAALQYLHRKARSLLTPSDVKCESLLWKDVKSNLHYHSGKGAVRCTYCTTLKAHEPSEKCWHSTLAVVFNNFWDSKEKKKLVKKPSQLPLGESFLRTEAKVILAYFLCSARINVFKDEMLGSSLEYVDLVEKDSLVIGHIGGTGGAGVPQRFMDEDLTKEDIDRILDGWPPFYRATFKSHEGHVLASPLTSYDMVRRPGWIVAIGLGRVQPTAVFVDNAADTERQNILFGYAIARVRRVLAAHFEVEWRGDKAVARAVEDIDRMLQHGASEQFLIGEVSTSVDIVSYPSMGSLQRLEEKEQCEALMRVFNSMAISAADKIVIDPVLSACMERVVLGVRVALKYSSTRRVLRVPRLLQGDTIVYLRDCKRADN